MTKWKDNNLLRESFVLRVGSAVYRPFTGKMTLDNYAYAALMHLKRDPAKTPQEIKNLDPGKTWIKSKRTGKICRVGYERRAPYHPGEPEEPPKIEVYDSSLDPSRLVSRYTYEELLRYFELLDGSPCGYMSPNLA